MKIRILNIKYGPNLGDGAIAECLEHQLRQSFSNIDIGSLDIGGRNDFGAEGSIVGARLGLTQRLGFLPNSVQSLIKTTLMPPMVENKYGQMWRKELLGCDAVIIGGGHLLMDVDLYFPYRIMLAIMQLPRGTPIFVHGVGVSKIWTPRGRACFERAFKHGRLISVSVRDKQSLDNWNGLFPNIKATLCRDPAILAADCYGDFPTNKNSARNRIAFGVADKRSMRQHADKDMPIVCAEIDSYVEMVQQLHDDGHDVTLFTNGADDDYLQKVAGALRKANPNLADEIAVAPRPSRPVDLVRLIANADVLIAHRLHANILAYAYGIPGIGLGWDRKLSSFFEASGRSECLIRTEDEAKMVPVLVNKLLSAGPVDHFAMINEARVGSQRLMHSIKDALL